MKKVLAGCVVLLGFLSQVPLSGQICTTPDCREACQCDDHCTSIAVGPRASIDGSVISSHDGCCANSRLHVVPAQDWPVGSMAPVYYGLQDVREGSTYEDRGEVIGQIPQVPHTYAYLHTGYPQMNEHQLMIAESTLYQRPELSAFADSGEQIMTIEMAQLFALQRTKTAYDAVKLIGSLLEEYGFRTSVGPASEGLLISDPTQVWLLEVASVPMYDWKRGSVVPGAIWVAQRIPDDHIVVFSVSTEVVFRSLTAEEIHAYIASGCPMDKAGAYAIQGGASHMVRAINGSYTNVVGLPLCELHETLASL